MIILLILINHPISDMRWSSKVVVAIVSIIIGAVIIFSKSCDVNGGLIEAEEK